MSLSFVTGRIFAFRSSTNLGSRIVTTGRVPGLLLSPAIRRVALPLAVGLLLACLWVAGSAPEVRNWLLVAIGCLLSGTAASLLPSRMPQAARNVTPVSPDPLSERPISDFADDLLDRKGFVEQWIEEMMALDLARQYVYSLTGPQGDGKTSALLLLEGRVAKDPRYQSLMVINFDPWLFTNPSAQLEGFYTLLDRAVNRAYFLPDLTYSLQRHKSLVKTGAAIAGFGSLDFGSGNDLLGLSERIGHRLRRLPIRLLLVVDDIDRLEKRELAELFRLIRITSAFPNLLVVLAYDEERLDLSMGTQASVRDKLVHQPKVLPPSPRSLIGRLVYWSDTDSSGRVTRLSFIDQLLQDWGVGEECLEALIAELNPVYADTLGRGISTIRDAKRYARGIRSSLKDIWREVNISDFLLLEYLKLFEPSVWRHVWENPELYVAGLDASPIESILEGTEGAERLLRERLEEVLSRASKRSVTRAILATVFGKASAALGQARINRRPAAEGLSAESELHFSKYFRMVLDADDVPDADIARITLATVTRPLSEATELWARELESVRERGRLPRLLEKLFNYPTALQGSNGEALTLAIGRLPGLRSLGPWDLSSEARRSARLVMRIAELKSAPEAGMILQRLAEGVCDEVLASELAVFAKQQGERLREGTYGGASEALERAQIRILGDRFGKGGLDIFAERFGWAAHLVNDWGRRGERKEVERYLSSLFTSRPEYWERLVTAFVRPETQRLAVPLLAEVANLTWLAHEGRLCVSRSPSEVGRKLLTEIETAQAIKPEPQAASPDGGGLGSNEA